MADLEELVNDICREMYEEAEPGLDWDDLRKNPDDYPDDYFERHYLGRERQREIFDEHCEDHDLTKREHSQLTTTVILGYAPAYPPRDGDGE